MGPVEDPKTVFTPGFPIGHRDFFLGRLKQIGRVIDTIPSPGRHPIIFGQRGVGKTSLVNILSDLLPTAQTVCINCDGDDTFKSIWNRVLQRAPVTFKERALGFSPTQVQRVTSLAASLERDNGVSAADVAGVLENVPRDTRAVFILDEFDNVTDPQVQKTMAHLIKNVSDHNPAVTFVIVGVAASIDDLIGGHPSIQRNLVQIEMPLMSDDEIKGIVAQGCERLRITPTPEVLDRVAVLSAGFPYYPHLLGLGIARASESTGARTIDRALFDELACGLALEESIQTHRSDFTAATKTANTSRFRRLLCACGYANHDEDGLFRTGDVVAAMTEVFGETVSNHIVKGPLAEFCAEERRSVLVRQKLRNVLYFRFRDPMMRPFLRIKAEELKHAG